MARSEITFIWSGVDRTGRASKGEVNAPSVAIAKAQLRRQGINAKRLRKKTQPLLSMGKTIDTRDIAVFTRQLATMTRAGVPMVQAIDIVMDGTDKALMKDLMGDKPTGLREAWRARPPLGAARLWFGCVFTPQPLRPAAAGVGGGPGKAHCASASRPPGPAQPPSPTPAARTVCAAPPRSSFVFSSALRC